MKPETLTHIIHAAKAGLAAVASYYLAHFLGMPESYWAAISSIIVMYSDFGRTMKAGVSRFVGTAIGATIGAAFTMWFGHTLWAFGVAVTLALFVCGLLGFADAARLAGVAVAIIMLINTQGRPWVAALHRFLEVSFGIAVALAFCAINWPRLEPTK